MSFQRDSGQFRQGKDPYQECRNFIRRLNKLADAKAEDLIGFLDEIGKDLARKVKIAQLRKVLDAFEKVRSAARSEKNVDLREETQPLKIHLAYAAGRQKELKPLQGLLGEIIDKVSDANDFKKLATFIEGLVAYHKFYGGD